MENQGCIVKVAIMVTVAMGHPALGTELLCEVDDLGYAEECFTYLLILFQLVICH